MVNRIPCDRLHLTSCAESTPWPDSPVFCSVPGVARDRRSATAPVHLGRTRGASAKLRQSDARWRASIQVSDPGVHGDAGFGTDG